MKVVGLGKLREFERLHGQGRAKVDAWVREAIAAEWHASQDITARYLRVTLRSGNRVVFAIGEEFRIDAKISFRSQVVVIVRIGTIAESDTWSF